MTIDGEAFADSIAPVAGAGDVDKDGTPDLLVGSPSHGFVWVTSGANGTLIHEVTYGPIWETAFGYSIDGAGDFNGDGTLDFVAGAPGDDTATLEDSGSVHVYSGVDASELAVIYGGFDGDRIGRWVAGLGDVNEDGFDDIGLAGFYDTVRIHAGPDGALIRVHSDVHTRPSIANVGDMDQDGTPDYAIGWPQDSTNGSWTGRVTVFSGRTGAEIHTVYGQTPHQQNVTTGDHLGLSVAGAGDVNADGLPDFVAGAPGEIELWYPSTQGMVRVYSGLDASILHEWRAETDTAHYGSQLGYRVAGGADLNGDDYADVLAAAPKEPLGIFLPGSINVFSGKTGETLWKVFGEGDAWRLEHHDVVGDLNHDGLADFGVGNPSDDSVSTNSGRVTVYAGAQGDATRYCIGAPNSAGPGARLELFGPISVGNNNLTLEVEGAIPSQFGLFFYGPNQTQNPFGDGYRCVGGSIFRLNPPVQTDSNGFAARAVDFTDPPMSSGPGRITPGSSWSFQNWYRDPAAQGAGFNLSDALRITFVP